MNQDEVRERLCKYIVQRGIKQSYISKVICLYTSNLSKFKQNKLNLPMKDLIKLDQFLKGKGY
jgi:predicted XRE-type DNA-binding protein